VGSGAGGCGAAGRPRGGGRVFGGSGPLRSGAASPGRGGVSLSVSPSPAPAPAGVAGFPPLEPGEVADGLARLADQSLLIVAASAGWTRYRAPETIRQDGTEQPTATGELAPTQAHQVRWRLTTPTRLAPD